MLYNKDLNKIAVRGVKYTKTYGELNNDVHVLMRHIEINGMQRIAIIAEQSYASYCTLWAAYLAGATLCCIGIDYPQERIKQCVDLFQPDIIISSVDIQFSCFISPEEFISVALNEQKTQESHKCLHQNNVLFVLFTSGSTGDPKGVAVLRKAFEDVIDWAIGNLFMLTDDVVGQYCSISFDMGLCDVFLALSVGAELVPIVGVSKLTPGRLISKYNISWIYAVPTLVDIFSKQRDFEKGNLKSLRQIGFGGAPLYERHMHYICENHRTLIIFNTYGPAETTLFTSCIIFIASDFAHITSKSVCLGNPLPGVTYELEPIDDSLCELVILGDHCFTGYLNCVGDIDFPKATSLGRYATGDIVSFENENYYFVSRKDNQVKVRGNRVSLDGIDAYISKLGYISVSTIINERLVTFCKKDIDLTPNILIGYLGKYLPISHIPDEIIFKDDLPLNKNGKYDRVTLKEEYVKHAGE